MDQNLIYGTFHESLVVGRESTLRSLASDLDTLAGCHTWGEVRVAEFSEYGPFLSWLAEDWADSGYEDSDEFDWQNDTPGMGDGDWPPMVTSLIFDLSLGDDWTEIEERLGAEMVTTTFSGDYLQIPPDKDQELVAFLTEQGYTVRRDDALISKVGLE